MPRTSADLPVALLGGRAVLAALCLAAPESAARVLGSDTGTARRVVWLTRMMAVRDLGLAVGGLTARGRGRAPWLLAGAAADAVDAVVVGQALRDGRLAGVGARALVPGAALAAGIGAVVGVLVVRD